MAIDQYKFVVFKDPNWDWRTFSLDRDVAIADKVDKGTTNAIDPNIRPFTQRGGKLLMYHGWADQFVSPGTSINYYNSVVKALGGMSGTTGSVRLFMAPGMDHCRGGEGPNTFDTVSALEQWVEQGKAPIRSLRHTRPTVPSIEHGRCVHTRRSRSTTAPATRTTPRASRVRLNDADTMFSFSAGERHGPASRWALALVAVLMPTLVLAQDRFFDANGVRIRYVEQGSGQPVVLVHGFSSTIETGSINPGVFSNLAKDHRVIALDLRGRGKSERPRDAKAYGSEVALDVVRLFDHLKIQRAHIVGYSMGGTIVLKLLTTHPDRFSAAVVGGSEGRRNWTAEDDRDTEAEALEFEKGTPFRSSILRTWPTDQPKPSEEAIQQLSQDRIKRGNDPAAFAADVRGRRAQAVTDADLAAVRVPTLALVGTADALIGPVNELKKSCPP